MSLANLTGNARTAPAMLRGLFAITLAALVGTAFWPADARSEHAEIAKRRAAERTTFTDAEIIDGFFRIVFGAEFHVVGQRRPHSQI